MPDVLRDSSYWHTFFCLQLESLSHFFQKTPICESSQNLTNSKKFGSGVANVTSGHCLRDGAYQKEVFGSVAPNNATSKALSYLKLIQMSHSWG